MNPLRCAVAGCNEEAYTVVYGAALCEDCWDDTLEIPVNAPWALVERILSDVGPVGAYSDCSPETYRNLIRARFLEYELIKEQGLDYGPAPVQWADYPVLDGKPVPQDVAKEDDGEDDEEND